MPTAASTSAAAGSRFRLALHRKDNSDWLAVRFDINNYQFRCLAESSTNATFSDSAFGGGIVFNVAGSGAGQTFDTNGNFTGPGSTETYAAWQGQCPPSGNTNVGSGASFRKVFPTTQLHHVHRPRQRQSLGRTDRLRRLGRRHRRLHHPDHRQHQHALLHKRLRLVRNQRCPSRA